MYIAKAEAANNTSVVVVVVADDVVVVLLTHTEIDIKYKVVFVSGYYA